MLSDNSPSVCTCSSSDHEVGGWPGAQRNKAERQRDDGGHGRRDAQASCGSIQGPMAALPPSVQTEAKWEEHSQPRSQPGLRMCVCVLGHFSRVRLFATPWTVVRQAPLSRGHSRQAYWSGLPTQLLTCYPFQPQQALLKLSPELISFFFFFMGPKGHIVKKCEVKRWQEINCSLQSMWITSFVRGLHIMRQVRKEIFFISNVAKQGLIGLQSIKKWRCQI